MIKLNISQNGNFRPVRIGYVPLTDAAPLIAGVAMGHFMDAGVEVELQREIGWATIREKLISGELDGAQLLAPMAVMIHTDAGRSGVKLAVPWILNRQGNTITLARRFLQEGVTDAIAFGRWVRSTAPRGVTLAVVAKHSSHAMLLNKWLYAAGLHRSRLCRIVVLPPAQMARSLDTGLIDGFCVGEPWGSLAVCENSGWLAATSHSLMPGHIEKVFALRSDFAEGHPDVVRRLLHGLNASAAECSSATGRESLAGLLAGPEWLDMPQTCISAAIDGPFPTGNGHSLESTHFHQFGPMELNRPSREELHELLESMESAEMLSPQLACSAAAASLFRADLFDGAFKNLKKQNRKPQPILV